MARLLGSLLFGCFSDTTPPVNLLAPRVELAGCMTESAAHVSDGRAAAIGDDVGNLSSVFSPISCVHVLNDLFASA